MFTKQSRYLPARDTVSHVVRYERRAGLRAGYAGEVMNKPTGRHRRHAELDELIAASSANRPVEVARAKRHAQDYANMDDEYDAALAVVASRS